MIIKAKKLAFEDIKGVKQSRFKEVRLGDFNRRVHDIKYNPIATQKKLMLLIMMRNGDDTKLQDIDGITTYSL